MRDIKKQQDTILDHQGNLKIGNFKDYFKAFHLRDKKRLLFKNFINNNTLTEWQAVEVLEGDIFLICAVFKFGIMNRTLFFLYDIKTNELHNFSSTSFLKYKSSVARSLEHNSVSKRTTNNTVLEIRNEFDKSKLYMKGSAVDISFDLSFERISKPVVISLPMTNKHTVYTEKDLLVPNGYIKYKNQEYHLNSNHITILDDHRGYYPLSSGYDWLTCMGEITVNNQQSKFGINLTDFYKTIDSTISENGYWLDEEFYPLPHVTFTRKENTWYIKDSEGQVNLVFTKRNQFEEKKNIPLKIRYTLAFGTLSGHILSPNNEVLKIDEMFSLGEERITQFLFGKYKQTKST